MNENKKKLPTIKLLTILTDLLMIILFNLCICMQLYYIKNISKVVFFIIVGYSICSTIWGILFGIELKEIGEEKDERKNKN